MALRCCKWFRKKPYADLDLERGQGTGVAPSTIGSSSSKTLPVDAAVLVKKIQQSKSTGVLSLRECGLKIVPDGATAIETAALRTVDLSHNKLKTLPEAISTWSGLRTLLCEDNALASIPQAIGSMVVLERLTLRTNSIQSLPAEVSQLGKLRTLSLEGNKLGPALPDVFAGDLAASLEELDVSRNGLKSLAPSLCFLESLRRLKVAGNELVELPESLGSLSKLEALDASDNLLRGVPPALLGGTDLGELWLKGNPMDRLELQRTVGFDAFLERRKRRIDAKIDSNVGNVDLSMCGLD